MSESMEVSSLSDTCDESPTKQACLQLIDKIWKRGLEYNLGVIRQRSKRRLRNMNDPSTCGTRPHMNNQASVDVMQTSKNCTVHDDHGNEIEDDCWYPKSETHLPDRAINAVAQEACSSVAAKKHCDWGGLVHTSTCVAKNNLVNNGASSSKGFSDHSVPSSGTFKKARFSWQVKNSSKRCSGGLNASASESDLSREPPSSSVAIVPFSKSHGSEDAMSNKRSSSSSYVGELSEVKRGKRSTACDTEKSIANCLATDTDGQYPSEFTLDGDAGLPHAFLCNKNNEQSSRATADSCGQDLTAQGGSELDFPGASPFPRSCIQGGEDFREPVIDMHADNDPCIDPVQDVRSLPGQLITEVHPRSQYQPSRQDFHRLSASLCHLSHLERWQCQHVAKAIVDNAINGTLEDMGLSPAQRNPDNGAADFIRQYSHVETAGVSQVIEAQGLRNPPLQFRTQRLDSIITRLTGASENLFTQNMGQAPQPRDSTHLMPGQEGHQSVPSSIRACSESEDEFSFRQSPVDEINIFSSNYITDPGNMPIGQSPCAMNFEDIVSDNIYDGISNPVTPAAARDGEPLPGLPVPQEVRDRAEKDKLVKVTSHLSGPASSAGIPSHHGHCTEKPVASPNNILDQAVQAVILEKGLHL